MLRYDWINLSPENGYWLFYYYYYICKQQVDNDITADFPT